MLGGADIVRSNGMVNGFSTVIEARGMSRITSVTSISDGGRGGGMEYPVASAGDWGRTGTGADDLLTLRKGDPGRAGGVPGRD